MADPERGTDLLRRARRFERDALSELFEPCLEQLLRLCLALARSGADAVDLAEQALWRCLDTLPALESAEESTLRGRLLTEASAAAARRAGGETGLRAGLRRLGESSHRLIALRILAGMPIEEIATSLGGRPAALRVQLVAALRAMDGQLDHPGLNTPAGLERFDAAVERVLAGVPAKEAAADVPSPTDVMALLRTVAGLRKLIPAPGGAGDVAALRGSLATGGVERRLRWLERHRGAVVVPGTVGRRYPSRRRVALLAIAILFPVTLGALLAAAATFADPDAPLYGMKRATESVLLAVNTGGVARAGLEISLANTRQQEAEDMAARGDGAKAVNAERDRFDELRAAARDLGGAGRTSAWRADRDRLVTMAAVPVDPIERDLETTGQGDAANEIKALNAGYQRDRDALPRTLPLPPDTRAPGPSPSPGAP